MFNRIKYYFSLAYKVNKFTKYLSENINLEIIDLGKGNKYKNIEKSTVWNKKIDESVNKLLPLFTYKTWQKILSIDNMYKKMSNKKKEDIRVNLTEFLKRHYLEIYYLLDMNLYNEYQHKNIEDIYQIIYIDNTYKASEKTSVLFFLYKDGSRIGYDVNSKNRVMLEELIQNNDTLIVTLVDIVSNYQSYIENQS